jgi:putative lumazine-binding protein
VPGLIAPTLKPSEPAMPDRATYHSLLDAVERYFDLMFDSDVSRFDDVFASTAQLHGLRDGNLRLLPAQDYKNALAAGPSPKSKNAPRQQQILLVDFASPTQAVVKVRVRIDTLLYLDYLAYHHINSAWLITAKSFHVEQRYEVPRN